MKGKHLAIELADHAARFVSMDNETVTDSFEILFTSQSKQETIGKLEDHLGKETYLNNDFEEVTLSWSTKRSTIVPKSIFNESTPASIFELCYGKCTPASEIDFNRINELSVVNIFEIADWVKQFFTVKFPRIIIQHEGTNLIRKIVPESSSELQVVVLLYRGYFQLIIANQNRLEFYSSFDYQSYEDVLYHLLFTLQQKELTNRNGTINIISCVGENNSMQDDVMQHIARVKDLKELNCIKADHLVAKSQLLCV